MANKLWEKLSFRCQKDGRIKEDITNTVRTWEINPYKSKLLNALWKHIPGLLMWTIWKERNCRIFKDQSSPLEVLWNNVCQNLRETLMLQTWYEEDFPSIPQEQIYGQNGIFSGTRCKYIKVKFLHKERH